MEGEITRLKANNAKYARFKPCLGAILAMLSCSLHVDSLDTFLLQCQAPGVILSIAKFFGVNSSISFILRSRRQPALASVFLGKNTSKCLLQTFVVSCYTTSVQASS